VACESSTPQHADLAVAADYGSTYNIDDLISSPDIALKRMHDQDCNKCRLER
jgi:hypothetical protein